MAAGPRPARSGSAGAAGGGRISSGSACTITHRCQKSPQRRELEPAQPPGPCVYRFARREAPCRRALPSPNPPTPLFPRSTESHCFAREQNTFEVRYARGDAHPQLGQTHATVRSRRHHSWMAGILGTAGLRRYAVRIASLNHGARGGAHLGGDPLPHHARAVLPGGAGILSSVRNEGLGVFVAQLGSSSRPPPRLQEDTRCTQGRQ